MTGPEFTVFMYDPVTGKRMSITVPTNCWQPTEHGVWLTIPGDGQYMYPWHRIVCVARRDVDFTDINKATQLQGGK